MIHSLMVKDSIYEGRYILSIREGKVYVKDTKTDIETELATASIDYFLSSGTISSSGLIELKVNEIPEPLKIDVKSFTDEQYISFNGKYGSRATDVPVPSESGHYLTWSGSGWFLDAPQTIPNIPNNIQDLQNVSSGNVTEGCLLIGSGNTAFKISNPRTISTSSSGYLRWSPSSGAYKLEDIIESITYSSGVLTLTKTNTSTTDIDINPVSVYSSGLGNENASTGEYIVWSSSSGQWVPESRLNTLTDSVKNSSSLVSASGIYNFTTTVVSDILTGGETSLTLSSISASGTIDAKNIITETLTASSGITLSSGTLVVQEGINASTIQIQTQIEISSGNLNLVDGDIILSGDVTSSGILYSSGVTSDTIQATQISASGVTSSGIQSEYLKLTGSGKNLLYVPATSTLRLDFDNNNSYYYSTQLLSDGETLENLDISNGVIGGQAIISLHGTGTILKSIKYIDTNAIMYVAPIEADIVLSDTVDALLTIHYSRNSSGKPVYYVVVSALNLVS